MNVNQMTGFYMKNLVSKMNDFKDFPAQKMKFSMKDFFSKFDQTRSFRQMWSHFPKKSLMENIIFCSLFINI